MQLVTTSRYMKQKLIGLQGENCINSTILIKEFNTPQKLLEQGNRKSEKHYQLI